jgi:hypothetical protein
MTSVFVYSVCAQAVLYLVYVSYVRVGGERYIVTRIKAITKDDLCNL